MEIRDPPHNAANAVAQLTMAFHNVNGIAIKDEELVRSADFMGAQIVGVCETLLYKERTLCPGQDGKSRYRWIFGAESERVPEGRVRGGVAFLVANSIMGAVSLAKADRNQLWIRVRDQKKIIYVGVVYLPPAGSAYAEERRTILRELSSNIIHFGSNADAIVIGGDLNARMGANGDQTCNAEGRDLKLFAQASDLAIVNLDDTRCVGEFTRERKCGSKIQKSTIDYVLVSSAHMHLVRQMTICDEPSLRLGSDHKPLKLDLAWLIQQGALSPSHLRAPTWNVDRCTEEEWKLYRDELEVLLAEWKTQHAQLLACGKNAHSVSSDSTALLELALKKAAAHSVGARYSYPKKYKPWIDANVLSLIHARDDLLALCNEEMRANHGTSDRALLLRERYQRQCRLVRNAIRANKRVHRSTLHDKLEQLNGKQMWRQLQSMMMKPRVSPDVIRRPDDTLATNKSEKLEEAAAYFERLGKQGTDTPLFDDDFARFISDKLPEHEEESIDVEADPILDADIKIEEVKAAIQKLQSGKAAGPDRIPNELLKRGGKELAKALSTLFQHVWQTQCWPEQWTRGNIVPLHKSGSAANLDNYRGITLLATMSKLFEIVLNSRLTRWAEGNHKLRDEQGGFRPNRRCTDQMFLLHEIIAARREEKLPTYCAFIDVRKAYDTVWRDGLWHSLWELDVRGKMYRMLKSMFAVMRRSVVIDGDTSRPFEVELGVAQGAVTSPFLYASFINALLESLDASGRGVTIAGVHIASLAYADDIVLTAASSESLKALLAALAQYAAKWRFRFNATKSNVMVFGTKKQILDASKQEYSLAGETISMAQDYKYLGCEASALWGRPSCVINRLIRAAKMKGAELSSAGGCRFNGVHALRSLRLWESYTRPVLEYASEVWTPTKAQAKKIESVVCEFARHALGVTRRTSNDFVMSELGMLSLAARRDELRLRYFQHLCTADSGRALSKVFRYRCDQIDKGKGSHSLCVQYKELLTKYDRQEIWRTRPADEGEWSGWQSKMHRLVVKMDLQARHDRLAARPSMHRYLSLKSHDKLTRAGYLSGRGLGVWIKASLRANTLPLLATLAKTSVPEMSARCAQCLICGEPEDATHFLLRCPGFETERAQFWNSLKEVGQLHAEDKHPAIASAAVQTLQTLEDGAEEEKLHLLLRTHEQPVKPRKKKAMSNGQDHEEEEEQEEQMLEPSNESDLMLLREVERIARAYMIAIWRKRALLIGGVPMLDCKGIHLTLGALQADGRSKFFASRG